MKLHQIVEQANVEVRDISRGLVGYKILDIFRWVDRGMRRSGGLFMNANGDFKDVIVRTGTLTAHG